MFVLRAKYNSLARDCLRLQRIADELATKWSNIVDVINAKGGQNFLDNAVLNPKPQFSQEEIRRLILLCHPDKHEGKQIAVEMTQKLLQLKE